MIEPAAAGRFEISPPNRPFPMDPQSETAVDVRARPPQSKEIHLPEASGLARCLRQHRDRIRPIRLARSRCPNNPWDSRYPDTRTRFQAK
jgi:hypothetical protein